MNELNNSITPSETTETESTTPTMQDIEKRYYSVENLADGMAYAQSAIDICTAEGVEPLCNFDAAEGLPEGYGLAIVPITKRVVERGNLTTGIVIAAIPDVQTVMDDDNGQAWAIKQINDALIKQVVVAAKPKDEGALTAIPFKLSEFISSARASGLAAFNLVGSMFVSALKKKGLKYMTKTLLRQVLASSAFAEQQFPRIGQENWVIVIKSMIAHAEKEGVDAGVLKNWLNTRDVTEIDTSELDLSDIDGMVDAG